MAKNISWIPPQPRKGVRVKAVSSLAGQPGVYATFDFEPYQLTFAVRGPVSKERTKYSLQFSEDEHIEPFEGGKPGFGHYLNHSCEPNAYPQPVEENGEKYIKILARRAIKKGEEIRVDYGAMEYDTTVSNLDCQCGAAKCRGKIKGFKDLDEITKGEYLKEGIIPEHLIRKSQRN